MLAIVTVGLCAQVALAQTVRVSGVVVDARTAQPLAGVMASVEGQPVFAETDRDGRFTLDVPPGTYTLAISLIGYAFLRRPLDIVASGTPSLRIELAEGAGALEEHVTVSGAAPREADAAPAGATLYGRDLQALRGVTLDDPMRALHALPSAAATDDFYSEFAVRGLTFRHLGLVVDGIPSRYLMHAVHGVSDGGSISMVNSDAVASVSLMPGSYPQRFGRRIGAQVDVATREGDRSRFRARAGLSGTSATLLTEGPLGASRGSWLVSARRSYLDLLLKRIEHENSLAFGFTDALARVVFDVTPKNQVQALAIAGRSRFDEEADGLAPNDEARVTGRTWLTGLAWRYTPSANVVITQRVYATGLSFDNINATGAELDNSRSMDAGGRAEATIAIRPGWLVEFGAEGQHSTGRHAVRRSLNDAPTLTTLVDYRASGRAASAYALATISPWPRLTVTPGARVDYWGATAATRSSPWVNAELTVTPTTRVRAGGGVYRQFADFEQIHGLGGGGALLRPETAHHVDLGVTEALPHASTLHVTWFARDERDVLWTPGSEPRRLADGTVQPARVPRWSNALDGRARGVEVVVRRDAPSGLSGWAGYAYGRHRYTVAATSESFWSDADQRHALSLFGHYPLSNRTTIGAKFRYGSNYPRVGYIAEQPLTPGGLFRDGGEIPSFFGLSDQRNTLRLPTYTRLDVRGDRTFNWSGRRLTLFGEVVNVLNHRNLRNVPYDVDRNGRVIGGTDSLIPILPSAGFVIEF